MSKRISFERLPTTGSDDRRLSKEYLACWLEVVGSSHHQKINKLHYVFLSDEELLDINRRFLAHDFYTDIITFPYSNLGRPVEGEIFVSIDRVRDNAAARGIPFVEEFHRVCVHGLLHLLGFDDGTDEEKNAMREAEDKALILRPL